MMGKIGAVFWIIVIVFTVVFMYACLVVAHEADEREEEWRKHH